MKRYPLHCPAIIIFSLLLFCCARHPSVDSFIRVTSDYTYAEAPIPNWTSRRNEIEMVIGTEDNNYIIYNEYKSKRLKLRLPKGLAEPISDNEAAIDLILTREGSVGSFAPQSFIRMTKDFTYPEAPIPTLTLHRGEVEMVLGQGENYDLYAVYQSKRLNLQLPKRYAEPISDREAAIDLILSRHYP